METDLAGDFGSLWSITLAIMYLRKTIKILATSCMVCSVITYYIINIISKGVGV